MSTVSAVDRFDVVAADGVSLAVWVDGGGPALVVVHGSIQDHTVSAHVAHRKDPAMVARHHRKVRRHLRATHWWSRSCSMAKSAAPARVEVPILL